MTPKQSFYIIKRATGYGELFAAAADAIGASGAFVRRFFLNIVVINFSRHKYALFET